MKKPTFILSLFFIINQANAGIIVVPQLLYVGQVGSSCTYSTIQNAIDASTPESEIRVSNEITYLENLSVNKNLTIKGGYANCDMAKLDSRSNVSRTVIDAQGVSNALVVSGITIELNMSGFSLTNGNNDDQAQSGGVSILSNDANISLEQMDISYNTGAIGGGIGMLANNINLNLIYTQIENNAASEGGGVYCSGNGFIFLSINSGILDNIANNGNGGGIYANNCSILLGTNQGGITRNSATNSGGGIYMDGGAIGIGGFSGIVNIESNVANTDMDDTGDGGGIYLTNTANIRLDRMFFDSNVVFSGNGGALFLDNSTFLQDTSLLSYDQCILSGKQECNLFINNQALGDGVNLGGAIYMQNNSSGFNASTSLRARFINNRADGGGALAVYSGSSINIQNSYFLENGNNGNDATNDFNLIRIHGVESEVDIGFSTLANNKNSFAISLIDGGVASIHQSIVYEDDVGNVVVSPNDSPLFSFNCSFFHEGATIGAIQGFDLSLITTDPGFVNPAMGDYHLSLDSSAIDRCSDSGQNPDITLGVDYDSDSRPIDNPAVINTGLGNIFDVGADEAIFINLPENIFTNGFE